MFIWNAENGNKSEVAGIFLYLRNNSVNIQMTRSTLRAVFLIGSSHSPQLASATGLSIYALRNFTQFRLRFPQPFTSYIPCCTQTYYRAKGRPCSQYTGRRNTRGSSDRGWTWPLRLAPPLSPCWLSAYRGSALMCGNQRCVVVGAAAIASG